MFNQILLLKRRSNPLATASVLVVAGGGGGGGAAAGGGGAGGLVSGIYNLSTTQIITVGGGGLGGAGSGGPGAGGGFNGIAGSNSSIGSLVTATGGGYGGSLNLAGGNGGSGGGGGNTGNQGTGTAGQGNNGGSGLLNQTGGGGGGAGAAGGAALTGGSAGQGGVGGNGSASSITGASVTYAGGGGGGGRGDSGRIAGTGGTGGGGNGSNSPTTAQAGTDGLGGGGGGGGYNAGGARGGQGGKGVVIISYASTTPLATGGTITTSGGNQIHTFSSNASAVYSEDFSAYSVGTSLGANPPFFTLNGKSTFTVQNFNADGAQGKSVYTAATAAYTSAGLYNVTTFSGNHAIQATISSNNTTPGSIYKGGHLGLCVDTFVAGGQESNGYALDVRVNDGITIYKMTGGSYAALALTSAAVIPASWTNYTMKFEKIGNILRGYLDGVLVVSASDSTYSSGYAEIGGDYDCAVYYKNIVISNDGTFTVL